MHKLDGIETGNRDRETAPVPDLPGGDYEMYYARLDKDKGTVQLLRDHLRSVAGNPECNSGNKVKFEPFAQEKLQEVCYWMKYFHDLGKYTDYFQDYLQNGKDSDFKNHAHISALLLYRFLRESMEISDFKKNDNVLAFFAYVCVRLHHGSLGFKRLFSDAQMPKMYKEMQIQGENLSGKAGELLMDCELDETMSQEKFRKFCDVSSWMDSSKLHLMHTYITTRLADAKWYFLLIYLFSILVDADKLDSAQLSTQPVNCLHPDEIVKYLKEKNIEKTAFVQKRQAARNRIMDVVEGLSDEQIMRQHIFTLTAPTGIGKTVASLECALRLQQKLHMLKGYTPRIITAIPFINIIEQTRQVYEEIAADKVTLIAHHRLADISLADDNREEISIDKKLLEMESWEGDIILTTFVQLFHSILSSRNRALKKINKLAGSIVILDEVQALPEAYMPLLGAVITKIAEYYGTYFILMTATQPRLLESANKILTPDELSSGIELLPDNQQYFQNLKRTKFVPQLKKTMNTQEFVEFFSNKWQGRGSALIVVNTIKRSIDVYTKIKQELAPKFPDAEILYLSTNIIPAQREEVIKNAAQLLAESRPVVMVSTQTIEAGVDLDFDMGFRDIAPLAALVQTAGRINRSGLKQDFSPIYIVQIESDNSYVYSLHNLVDTRELLAAYTEITEPEYQQLINQYFSLTLNRPLSTESKNIWSKGIMKLDFEEIDQFKLIDNAGDIIDVFVEYDSKASSIADAYEEILSEKENLNLGVFVGVIDDSLLNKLPKKLNVFERKTLLRIVQAMMNKYIIQVRTSRAVKNRPVELSVRNGARSNLFWIPPAQIDDYYNRATGFIDESGRAYIF